MGQQWHEINLWHVDSEVGEYIGQHEKKLQGTYGKKLSQQAIVGSDAIK